MEIDELIAKYLSGEADPEEVREIIRWKKSSPENESMFRQSEDVWRLAHDQQKYIPVDRERTWNKIQKRISRQYSLSIMLRVAGIAASVALVLGLALPYLFSSDHKKVISDQPQIISLYVPGGVCSKTVLPDSTVVWLNASSSLNYPSYFTGDTRTVELVGEAFFDVARDESKPFIIQSGNIRVNVLGTSFNFKHYKGDTHAVLAVETGTVTLSTGTSKTTNLKAGQFAKVNNRTLQTQVFDVIPAVSVKKEDSTVTAMPGMVEKETHNNQFSVWRNYVLVFRDEPFNNILNELARRYNVEFEIQDKELTDYVYTATFNDMSLEDILKLLKTSSPIDYTIKSLTSNTSNAYEKRKVTVFRK